MYKTTVPTIVTNGHFNREKTLKELKRCGTNRIALAIDRELQGSFSSEQNLSLLRDLIRYFRENGLETMVWLGETLGHPTGKAEDPRKHAPYQRMRAVSGETMNAFCPLDQQFVRDVCKWIADIAACGADMIMLDDDFRLAVRFVGDGMGCCCDLHMKRLRQELGDELSVEQLRDKVFLEGPNAYRDIWQRIQKESLTEFAQALRDTLDQVSPETRLGFCSCFDWDITCDVLPLAKTMAGRTKPFVRLCGAPYWARDRKGFKLGQLVELERMQIEWCSHTDCEIFSEGDTYPRPRTMVPAAYLECFDMILRASGGADGILKYMLDYCSDADYETGYVDAAVENEELYRKIGSLFDGKTCVGLRPFHFRDRFRLARPFEDGFRTIEEYQFGIFRNTAAFAVMNSLPTTYSDGPFFNILFGDDGRYVSEAELMYGSVIDCTAARILMDRDIDVGIAGFEDLPAYSAEGFTDTPSEFFINENQYVRLAPGVSVMGCIQKPGAQTLSEFCFGKRRRNGVFEYRNERGMFFLVLPFNASDVLLEGKTSAKPGWLDSYARRRQLIQAISHSGHALPVYGDGNYPYLYFLAKQGEGSVSVGLWNLYPDRIRNLRIHVAIDYSDVAFVNCSGHSDGNDIILDTVLYPYEFAGFELKTKKGDA